MLYIYTKLDGILASEYINDIELFFEDTWKKLCMHKEARNVLKKIDGASIICNDIISTKFGDTSILNLSTGCKALLIALTYNSNIVNYIETGGNVFNETINLSKNYDIHIYLPYRKISNNFSSIIVVNGKKCTVLEYMKDWSNL